MTRSPNHNTIIASAPDSNYADFRPEDDSEKYTYQDYAGAFVEVGRQLQQGMVMNGASSADMQSMFEPNSAVRAGAPELQSMADHIRANHRGEDEWLPYENQFLTHMALEAQVEHAVAGVDFNTLRTRPGIADPIMAERRNIGDIISSLSTTRSATTDPAQRSALRHQIRTLQAYRSNYLTNPDLISEHETPRMGGMGSMENDFVQANIAAENEQGPRAETAQDDALAESGRLASFDRVSRVRVDALNIIREHGYEDAPVQGPTPHVMEHKIATRPYNESPEEQKLREEMEDIELHILREEKAQFDVKSTKQSINGRSRAEVTAEYEHARDRKILREYGHIFNDPYVDPKMKDFVQAKALAQEWGSKRHEEDKVLKNTPMAKICRWIGKHKLIVVGASALLAPMTAGTSIGFGLAFSSVVIAGAKVDEKVRGLHAIDVSEKTQDLYKYMRDGNDYAAAAAYMDRISSQDINREFARRVLSVTAASTAAGLVGNYYLGSMPGAETLHNLHPYFKGSVYAGIFASMVRNKGGGGHH